MPKKQLEIADHGSSASLDELKHTAAEKNPEFSGVKKEVALKIISKRKVKGNEEAVWGEMEVLRGLDHPNIVCLTF